MANSAALKRILREARELGENPSDEFCAAPLDDNVFEWHFTFRGPKGTPFEGGLYHGRITLPPEYPFRPPSIFLLTPSGRFEVNKKICLSVSSHHPESWQPAWGIRTIIIALMAFFPSKAEGALAGLDYSDSERQQLAERSLRWCCPRCKVCMADALPAVPKVCVESPSDSPPPELQFAVEPPASASVDEAAGNSSASVKPNEDTLAASLAPALLIASSAASGDTLQTGSSPPPGATTAAAPDRLGQLAVALFVVVVALLAHKLGLL